MNIAEEYLTIVFSLLSAIAVDAFYFVKVLLWKWIIHISNSVLMYLLKSELKKFVEEVNKKRATKERQAGRKRIYSSFVKNFVSKKGNK